MIKIDDIRYINETNITSFTVTFSHDDYVIINELSEYGILSESDIEDLMYDEYTEWIKRIQ